MNTYFARLAEMSGVKVKAQGVDTNLQEVSVDNRTKSEGEDNKLASLFHIEEGSGFHITSASGSEKEELSSKIFSQIDVKHKLKTLNSSVRKRENTKLNPSYLREATGEDFISTSDLSSERAKRSEVDEVKSSTGSTVTKRGNVRTIYDDKEDSPRNSDVTGNKGQYAPSVSYLTKNMDLDETRRFKGYLDKLLDMPSIKSDIIRNGNKALGDSSKQLVQSTYNYNLPSLSTSVSNSKKPNLKGDISVSIGTIILNVIKTNSDIDNPRNQILSQKPESSHYSTRSRLHRYYGILR
jgi:hypothetical protein